VQDRIIAKAVQMHPTLADRSDAVEKTLYLHQAGGLGFLQASAIEPKIRTGARRSCANTYRPAAQRVGIQKPIRMAYVPSHYSTCCERGTEFKVMQELLRHSSSLNVGRYTQAVTPAKQQRRRR